MNTTSNYEHMKLEKSLKQSLEWMSKHNVDAYYGFVFRKKNTEVNLDTEEMPLSAFFEFLQKMEISTVFIYKSVFDVEDLVEGIDMENITNANQIKQLVDGLRGFDNQLDLVAFNCIKDNVVYNYLLGANWGDKVEEVENQIKELITNNKIEEEDPYIENAITQEETDEIIRLLVNHDSYFKIRNISNKVSTLLSSILESSNLDEGTIDWYERDKLKYLASEYFDKNLLKDKEEELRNEISKMKEKGLTKVAMRGKLDISSSMLNKYFY